MQSAVPTIQLPLTLAPTLVRARQLAREGDIDGSLEAIASAAVLDIQVHQQQFLGDVRACAIFGDLISQALGPWIAGQHEKCEPREAGGPIRFLYLAPNLGSGQAASMNLARLVEWHTRSHAEQAGSGSRPIEVRVVVCEEFTMRNPPLGYLRCPEIPTSAIGGELLERLQQSCKVTVLSTDGSFLDAAESAIEYVRSFAPDVACFIGSPACAVQTAVAAARVAPVQVCLNIGVPMLSPGIDAVIYNNPSKRARDAAFIESRGIEVFGLATSGGDARVGAEMEAFPRKEIGVPEGVPLLASMSNVLVRRMLAGTFARDLAAFLRRNPDTWWLGIGFCEPAPFYRFLETVDGGEDVRRRCVFTGGWSKPWGMVKSCQMLLNEYPEGGGNSVIETMGCGVPVVAMRAGPRHAESIGAELVGGDAIQSNDIEAYWALAEKWLRDPGAARAAGARQQARAVAELDYGVICDKYERILRALATRHARPAGPKQTLAAAG